MKILHYTLGFAPERSGGLVRYATDLMQAQVSQGHDVVALYPGAYRPWQKASSIGPGKKGLGFQTYRLINSPPLPISGGILSPDDFMARADKAAYQQFLQKVRPDLIHLHTLMGLHKEWLEAVKTLDIPVVMTSHDYFGLAPVPSFYGQGRSFTEDNSNQAWQLMSQEGMSTQQLRLFQAPFYPQIRRLARLLKRQTGLPAVKKDLSEVDYSALMDYYQSMFALVDGYHFNSHLARQVFEKNLSQAPAFSRVLNISHGGIKPLARTQTWTSPPRLAYIGPDFPHKGFDFFVALAEKWQSRPEAFDWHTWGHAPRRDLPGFIQQHGSFGPGQASEVYQSFDVLIVPSQWAETFGFIVLEALSYGKMVLASNQVGAKDLLPEAWVFKNEAELSSILEGLTEQHYQGPIKGLVEHVAELEDFYQEVIRGGAKHG
ncbi:glycosyltransferase involved in cell wall biosynthesis [Streptococcus rupicaprae]|uniref:Glycosyltransferase involved in cell wall biosynthesis n=1 Tax=Streptococcus rupicaprae TaxID=759619 RepID=A0ABV2FG31_9STRE